jgi:hypothetical protein
VKTTPDRLRLRPLTLAPGPLLILLLLADWLKAGVGRPLCLAGAMGVLTYVFRTWLRTRFASDATSTLRLTVGLVTLTSSSLFMLARSFVVTCVLWTRPALAAASAPFPTGVHVRKPS